MPGDLAAGEKQTIIAAEVYYEFKPLLIGTLMPAHKVYHRAFFRTRLGALNALAP